MTVKIIGCTWLEGDTPRGQQTELHGGITYQEARQWLRSYLRDGFGGWPMIVIISEDGSECLHIEEAPEVEEPEIEEIYED